MSIIKQDRVELKTGEISLRTFDGGNRVLIFSSSNQEFIVHFMPDEWKPFHAMMKEEDNAPTS